MMPLWQGRTNIKISLNQKTSKKLGKSTDKPTTTKKHDEKYANNEEGNGIT